MKQLKRILTIVLALSIILTSVAFAELDPRLDGRWSGSGYCRGEENRKSPLSACIAQNGKYRVTIDKLKKLVLENTFDCNVEESTMVITVLYENVTRKVKADYAITKKGLLKVNGVIGGYKFFLTFTPTSIARPSIKISKRGVATVKTNAKANYAIITDEDYKVVAIGPVVKKTFQATLNLLPGKNVFRAFSGTLDMDGKMIPVAVGDVLDLAEYGAWISDERKVTRKV